MRKTTLLASLVVFSQLVPAAVKSDRVIYVGGSAAIAKSTQGTIDLEDQKQFRFQYDDKTFAVPYDLISSMEFGDKAGVKSHLAMAVSWVPKFGNKQVHLLTIDFKDEQGSGQAAIFEISKELSQTVIPVLEARTNKHVRTPQDEDQPLNADGKKPEAQPARVWTLVPVTITSTPSGATVSFWGQTAGQTPVTTKLAPGNYTVTLSSSGLPAWKREIVVESGKPLTIAAEMGKPASGATVAAAR